MALLVIQNSMSIQASMFLATKRHTLELTHTSPRYASAKSVAESIYEAAKKKKTKVVLDSTASFGVTVYGLFPGTINSAVKKEVRRRRISSPSSPSSPPHPPINTNQMKTITDKEDEVRGPAMTGSSAMPKKDKSGSP